MTVSERACSYTGAPPQLFYDTKLKTVVLEKSESCFGDVDDKF